MNVLDSAWFFSRQEGPGVELFCLHHAGGQAHAFSQWVKPASEQGLRITPVQLPGRGPRMREPAITSVRELVEPLASAIVATGNPQFGIFGHSFGALVGFELTRALTGKGCAPLALFVSGSRSAFETVERRWHALPDDELKAVLRDLGGIPEQVFAHEQLMALVLSATRADLQADETYDAGERTPVQVPVIAFSGADDPFIAATDVARWRDAAGSGFEHVRVQGGHFFLSDPVVLETVQKHLRSGEVQS